MSMKDSEIISILKTIVGTVGIGTFANHVRANALVSGFFSGIQNARIRHLLKSLIGTDAFLKISRANANNHNLVCAELRKALIDDKSLSEERAELAIGWACEALDKPKPYYPGSAPGKLRAPQYVSNSMHSSTQQSFSQHCATGNTYGINPNHHIKRQKPKRKVNRKLIGWIAAVCAVVVLMCFVIWPKLMYPNLPNEELYTPEIIQTYSGSYSTEKSQGEAVVTILSCDPSGYVQGYFEFVVGNIYGKYEIFGQITKKKNNGNLEVSLRPGQWLIQPAGYSPLETMTIEISSQYQKLVCSQYNMHWSIGVDEKNSIKTAEDLRKLANTNGVFHLRNNIDLAGMEWAPIPGFSGTLIGNGYAIQNMKIHAVESDVGLFSSMTGTISNLKLENVDIEVQGGYENIGALCGVTNGSINGCEVSGTIKAPKCTNVGGLVGKVASKNGGISGCKNSATIIGMDHVGGVSGYIYTMFSFGFIANENFGSVSGNNYIGGLLGYVAPKTVGFTDMSGDHYSDLVVKKCVNNGVANGNNYVGGIAGSFSGTSTFLGFGDYYTVTSTMCDNTNNAEVNGADYVGGLAGYTGGLATSISNCYNNADISGNYYVGGYVGYSSRAEIQDVENKNKVTGKAYVGGIAGVGYSFRNCTNNGTIESTGTLLSDNTLLSCTGGIAGQANFIHNCVNYTDIIVESSGYYVGGIVGIIKSDAIINMDGSKNYGNVTGYAYVGGFAGAISSQPGPGDINYYEGTLIISNVLNSGNISALTEYAGGITGHVEGAYRHYGFGDCKNVTYQISFCVNTGEITGRENVDGIAGKMGPYVVTDRTVLGTNESTGMISKT